MKKIILILICIQQIATAQSELSVFPNEPYTELSTMAVDGNYIYTAGDCNTGLVSQNGGVTWETITIEDRPKSIKIVPGSNGQKAFYQYSDGIYTFDINTLEFEEITSTSLYLSSGNYQSIEVSGDKIYVISNQNIHKATVGEYNWEKIADFNFQNDAVLVTDATSSYLYIGSLNGLLLRLALNSESLEQMTDFKNRIYSMDMTTDDIGYFSIQNFTNPVRTTNGGADYSDLTEMPENIGVIGYGENVVMTVNTNRIYVSMDGGQTSTYVPIPDDGTYDLVYTRLMTDDGALYLAGRSSMIIKSEDFCTSFENLNAYKRENLQDIEFHPSGTGVAVGGYSSIIKTSDGGDTWALQNFLDGSQNYLNAVTVLSQNQYLIAGNDELYIVENDAIVETIPVSLDDVIYNETGNYLIGLRYDFGDRSIVKSTDGGLTWESKAFIPQHRYHVYQSPSGKIFVPGIDGVMYTSIDGGDSWDIESFGEDVDVSRLVFLDENKGLASTGLKLYMTTDGGATAELVTNGYDIRNLQYIDENNIVYTTSNEAQTNFHESSDGGASFTPTKKFCSQSSNSFRIGNVIWLAQNGGHINKYKVETSLSTSNEVNNALAFFPNPISVGQKITIETKENITKASIISFSGKMVKKLKATHDNTLSTAGLPSGLYTLTVQTNNGKTMYGKLVIIE